MTSYFRQRKCNFTIVSSEVLKNKELSLKAKGLFALIVSYISIPNFILYKSFLMEQSSDGTNSFNTAWKELLNAGYLTMQKVNTCNGFTYIYDINDSSTSINDDMKEPRDGKPTSGKPISGKSTSGESRDGKPITLIINKKINKKNNNILNIDDINDNNNLINIKLLKETIIKSNKEYNCFNDERFKILSNDPNSLKSMNDFKKFHDTLKINYLYKFENIAYFWLRIRESYNSLDLITKTENKVIEVLSSFKNSKDQECILNFSVEDINNIFEIAFSYYDPFEKTDIYDINGYLSSVVRSKFNI